MAKQARRVRQQRIQRHRRKARDRQVRVVVPLDGLGDLKQLAELCQVSPRTARRLVEAGILPAPIRLGPRTVRWDMAQVRAVLAAAASGQIPCRRCPNRRRPPPEKRTTRRGAGRTRARATKWSDLTEVDG